MESFPTEWVPITFKDPPEDKGLTLAQYLPYLCPKEIHNPQAKFDGRFLWVSYDIPIELHTAMCQSGHIVYGTKEQEGFIHISLMSNDKWYWDTIQPDIPLTVITLTDIPSDIFRVICPLLTFEDQLSLRQVCRGMHSLIHYSDVGPYTGKWSEEHPTFKESRLMIKAQKIVGACYTVIWNRYKVMRKHNGINIAFTDHIPDEHKVVGKRFSQRIDCSGKCRIYYGLECGCGIPEHTFVTIFGEKCHMKEVMNYISDLMVLEKLIKLLEFDKELTDSKNSFTKKDKRLMSKHSKDYKLSSETQGNASHFHKTNDCYFKYNKDLRQIFDVSEWFNKVKDMICGIVPLIGMDKFEEIDKAMAFGQEVLKNYKGVRHTLHLQKQKYYDKKHHRGRYDYYNSSSDSD